MIQFITIPHKAIKQESALQTQKILKVLSISLNITNDDKHFTNDDKQFTY